MAAKAKAHETNRKSMRDREPRSDQHVQRESFFTIIKQKCGVIKKKASADARAESGFTSSCAGGGDGVMTTRTYE